ATVGWRIEDDLRLKFTGTAPWDFTYTENSTGNSYPINGITGSDMLLTVLPNSSYIISANTLKDKYCTANSSILLKEDVAVKVNELPTAVLSGDATICNGDATSLNISVTGNGSWNVVYTDGNTNFSEIILNGSTNKSISVSPTSQTSYSLVSVSDANCKGTVSGTATIKVTSPPSAAISYDPFYCNNVSSEQQVKLTNGSGNYLGGKFSSTAGLQIDPFTGAIIPNLSQSGKYVVSYTIPAFGGCPQKMVVSPQFEIRQLPIVDAGISDTLTCIIKSVKVGVGTTSSANTYEWSGGSLGVIFSTKNEATTYVDKAGKYTLKVTEIASGCMNSDEVEVAIDTMRPFASAGPDDTLFCNKSLVNLDAKFSSSEMDYLWTGGPTGYLIPNASNKLATTTETGIYSLLVTNPRNGCHSRDTVVISENRVKPIVFAADTSVLTLTCTKQKVTLGSERSVKVSGTRYFFSWSGAPVGYIFKNSNQRITEIDTTGNYIIYVLDNYNGCENRDTVLVIEDSKPPLAKVVEDTIVLTCLRPLASLDGSLSSTGSRFSY
ncbi:MAG: hypothetical protein EB100_06650, partial [Crocinitomicaceae bacterium]|nr:hypothetical protein [Crocinitomicaceae bacterium]